jgi:hypothetical protein
MQSGSHLTALRHKIEIMMTTDVDLFEQSLTAHL